MDAYRRFGVTRMILLDTTACIDYLRGYKPIKSLIQNMNDLFAITTISIYEVSIGLERTKRMKSDKIYQQQFLSWNKFKALMKILDFSPSCAEEAAKIYDQLSENGKIIDDNDIMIAGIMHSRNIKRIITRNQKHFESIPGIKAVSYEKQLK